MTGLRLTREGISSGLFHQRFAIELMDLFGNEIDELVHLGLLEWNEISVIGNNTLINVLG